MQGPLACDERLDYPIPVEQEPNSSPSTSKRALDCIYLTHELRASRDSDDSEPGTDGELSSSSEAISSGDGGAEDDLFSHLPNLVDDMDGLLLNLGSPPSKPPVVVRQKRSPLEAVRDPLPPHADTRLYLFSQPCDTPIEPRLFVWLDDKPDPVTRRPNPGEDCWRAQAAEVFAWFHHAELETRRVVMACAGFHPALLFVYLCELLRSFREASVFAEAEGLRGNRAAVVERWQSLWVFPFALPVGPPPRRKHGKVDKTKTLVPQQQQQQQLYFVRYDLEFLGDFVGMAPDARVPDAMLCVVPLEREPRAFAMCNLAPPPYL